MKPLVLHKILVLLLICILFNSCYEDYLIINSEYKSGTVSADSSQIFFFHYLKAGQPPKGISRFPDGGTQKVIYRSVSLYCLDIKKDSLFTIYNFENVPFSPDLDHISVNKNLIAFSISPLMGWKWIENHSNDSSFNKVYNQYNGFFVYNKNSDQLKHFSTDGYYPILSFDEQQIIYLKRDTAHLEIWHLSIPENENRVVKKVDDDTPFILMQWKDSENVYYKSDNTVYELNINNRNPIISNATIDFYTNQVSANDIKKLTSNRTYQDWGFDVRKHWLKSQNEYINDIILLNGNLEYRKAIIEEMAPEFNDIIINDILQQMNKHEKELEGYQQQQYNFFSEDTKNILKKYLE